MFFQWWLASTWVHLSHTLPTFTRAGCSSLFKTFLLAPQPQRALGGLSQLYYSFWVRCCATSSCEYSLILSSLQTELHPWLPHDLREHTPSSPAEGRDHGHSQDGCWTLTNVLRLNIDLCFEVENWPQNCEIFTSYSSDSVSKSSKRNYGPLNEWWH